MKIIVTGGAGYIGSHIVKDLIDNGNDVTIFDDLSTGKQENVDSRSFFIKGSTLNLVDVDSAFNNNFDALIHLAAFKDANDSMLNMVKYSNNNIVGSLNVMNACIKFGINKVILSSTAAVYGLPNYLPIDEIHPLNPLNYYGETKKVIENTLEWYSRCYNLNFVILRYFNAAGYDSKNRKKGLEQNPSNLIPIVMETAIGKRKKIEVFGNDFDTKDGTGVRDYIHVTDLSSAHLKSLDYLVNSKKNIIINLGTTIGYSVLDIIQMTENISNKKVKYSIVDRRIGDADAVLASNQLAKDILEWEPKFSDLDNLIRSTWVIYNEN